MLSPRDTALLRIAVERGILTRENMMDLINYKVRQAPRDTVDSLLLQKGYVDHQLLSQLASEADRRLGLDTIPSYNPVKSGPPLLRPRQAPAQSSTLPDLLRRPPPPSATEAGDGEKPNVTPAAAGHPLRWPLSPGTRIGHHVIKSVLGKGGMGQVFRVFNEKLERDYALKVLLPGGSINERTRARFRHEARATARLRHPNIVAVHEVGEEGGLCYFTMDLIEGTPLSVLIRSGSVELAAGLKIICKMANALHHAHREGVIHRDLKPSNIIVSDSGEPYLMDFGLAKELHAETNLTRTGTAVGTLAYMPPEQARGDRENTGPKSDVYSLGVTLYEILTGRLPHVADSAPALIAKLINDDPVPPHLRAQGIAEPISLICMKAMKKNPHQRYGTAMDFCRDIERFLDGEPVDAEAEGIVEKVAALARKNRPAAVLATALLAVLLGIAGWLVVSSILEADAYNQSLAVAQDAEEKQDWAGALEIYNALVGRHPDDGRAYLGAERVREAQAREQQERASEAVRKGKKLLEDLDQRELLLEEARRAVVTEGNRVELGAPLEDKKALFDARKALADMERQAALLRADAVVAFHSALGLDADNAEAKRSLSELYAEDLRRAEQNGDRDKLAALRAMVALYSGGSNPLARAGSLQIQSMPSGAEVFLFALKDRDLRRVAMAFSPGAELGRVDSTRISLALGESFPLPLSPENSLGRTPIPRLELPQGNYLLLLHHPALRDTLLPIAVGRGSELLENVRLFDAEEVGEDFVYVPAGYASIGGDRGAFQSLPRDADKPRFVNGFFIGRHEVTRREYARFLDEVGCGDENDLRNVPRRDDYALALWERGPNGWIVPGSGKEPVAAISHDDAVRYCRWLSERDGKRYRLPDSVEWEKAARGIDGRLYVWGDDFEPSFSCNGFGQPHGVPLPEVGSFPFDTSVYGVCDLGGSVREHCENMFRTGELPIFGRMDTGLFEVRGAGFSYMTDLIYMRAATRFAYPAQAVRPFFGFRLVKEIDE